MLRVVGIITNVYIIAGTLDPMIAGKKVRAVFAFCDLRNFSKVYFHFTFVRSVPD